MLKKLSLLLLVAFLIGISSCKKNETPASNVPIAPTSGDVTKTILGQKMVNAFTVENMQAALNIILNRTNGRINSTLQPTHKYIRFKPNTLEDVITLDGLGYELSDVPMDQDIEYLGDWYHDPSIPSNDITYLYTVLPINEPLPPGIISVKLADLYLFDEESYDGDTLDEDPWDPGDGSFPCPNDPSTWCYARITGRKNMYKEATQFLVSNGIKPIELFNEALRITGNIDEMVSVESVRNGRTNRTTWEPMGRLTVQDIDANIQEPLKGVTVKARRWFKLRKAFTNVMGDFRMPGVNFRKKATVYVKFKSGAAKVRGINGALAVWQYAFPTKRNIGLFNGSDMQNINFQFNYNANGASNLAMHWVAATTMNAVWDMYQYCQANNIPLPPPNLNIWVSSAVTQAASTPMLRYITNTSAVSQAIDLFLLNNPVMWNALALKKLIQANLPDITLRYGDNNGAAPRTSFEINNTLFHELAHSIHYGQVGNNYWAAYINYILVNGVYGDKTDPDAERIALSEAWGFFIGNTFNATKYNPTRFLLAQDERDQLENQTPNDTEDFVVGFPGGVAISRGWIPAGMFHDMIDNGETVPVVIDNVNAYNIQRIFSGLQTNVTTVQGYRTEVLNRNGNLQANELNQLVTSYRY